MENQEVKQEEEGEEQPQQPHNLLSEEAQARIIEGGRKGGQTRAEQLGHEGYVEMGRKGGQTRAQQLGHEGYAEMGRKGGLATKDMSGEEAAQEKGIEIDESKYRTK